MKGVGLSRLVALFLAVVLPTTTLFAQPASGAVLNANGAVVVNGSGVARSAAVYNGDSVRTNNGFAEITFPGSKVAVGPNSTVIYRWKALDLTAGTVAVSTSTGVTVQAGSVTVKPASAYTTRYELAISGNTLTIKASLGNLSLNVGGSNYEMAEGTSRTVELLQNLASKDQTPPPAMKSPSSSHRVAWLVLGGGAGAAALGIAATSGKSSVSPSKP